jgi:hypothetical protein
MATQGMTEGQAVNLVRNALLAAGHEMGEGGDHWPVIKATIQSIMKDYEDWQIEQNVFAEVKKHYRAMINELEVLSKNCPAESKAKVEELVTNLLDLHNACFTPMERKHLHISEKDFAPHLRRADAIIKTLEDDNG